jgi:hypothetical protein
MYQKKNTGGVIMKCHGDNKGKQGNHKHSPLKHMLHMVLCCGLPIVMVGFLPLISKISPGAAGFVSKIVPFLCPLMMIGMMAPMLLGKNKKSCCDESNQESSTKGIV